MSYLYKDGSFQSDRWLGIDGDQPVPEGEDIIVSLALFEDQQHALLTRNSGRLGVHLEADDQLDAIVPHLDKLEVISLDFPSFADGRAFSKARWLRDQHGFAGEVRAVGDVRIDQVSHMKRCGFDALLVTHQQTIDSLTEIKDPSLSLYYQPAAGDTETKVGGSRLGAPRVRKSYMKISVTAPNGESAELEALEGFRVMEVIRDWSPESGIGIKAECGGACACATCHVYVAPNWVDKLPRLRDDEEERLDETFDVQPNSRLSCQLIMTEELDGLEVRLAADASLPIEKIKAA